MRVELEGIKFNYAPDDLNKTGAFNLRRNETQAVCLPEWPPEQSESYEASPAAYAICGLPAEMTIQASFNCESPIKVRAIAEFTDHILGDVEPIEINNTGSTGYITLKLPDACVAAVGVGIHDISWRWQYSTDQNVWTDFQTTRHRIYTVLARPSDPWEPKSSAPDNVHQPWTEVLDFACEWAASAHCDLDHAAEVLTKEFFKRVSKLVSYKKAASYAFSKFKCTQFLNLLKTGIGGNQTLNCDDCATVVSTFANILGCQLSQSSLGVGFDTQPVVFIGSKDFVSKRFRYHSVAWKGQCNEGDELFDGCLQIDEDLAPPPIAIQPTNLPFGNEKEGYRFSLVSGAPNCGPIPNHSAYGRRRRKLGNGYLADAPITDQELLSELKRDYHYESWPKSEEAQLQGAVTNNTLENIFKELFTGSAFHSGNHFQDDRFPNVVDLLFRPSGFTEGQLIAVTVYQCKATADPNLNLLEILGRFEELDMKLMSGSEIGNVALADDGATTLVFRRARWLAVVRSAGKRPVSVIENAQIVDNFLTAMSGQSITDDT